MERKELPVMKNAQYESPIKALLESLESNFANTVNPKGSLEIEQIVVDGFTASQETVNASQLPKHEVAMAIHHLAFLRECHLPRHLRTLRSSHIEWAMAFLADAQTIMTPETE